MSLKTVEFFPLYSPQHSGRHEWGHEKWGPASLSAEGLRRNSSRPSWNNQHGWILWCNGGDGNGKGGSEGLICLCYITELYYRFATMCIIGLPNFILSRYFFRRWTKRVIVRYTMWVFLYSNWSMLSLRSTTFRGIVLLIICPCL